MYLDMILVIEEAHVSVVSRPAHMLIEPELLLGFGIKPCLKKGPLGVFWTPGLPTRALNPLSLLRRRRSLAYLIPSSQAFTFPEAPVRVPIGN